MPELTSVKDALGQLLSAFSRLPAENVSLAHALGRVLAEDVSAVFDLPPFTNSGMDGYAVRAADTTPAPQTLTVIGDIPAGLAPELKLQSGQAARIMTGAMLPAGADAVIPIEWTDQPVFDPSQGFPHLITTRQSVQPGDFIRPLGQDVRTGQTILSAGHRLCAQDLGLLASFGLTTLKVVRRPRVALLSTGDELVEPGLPLPLGKIYNSNSVMLGALVRQFGGQVCFQAAAPDHPQAIHDMFARALEQSPDLLLTSAGVSVGAFDYVRDCIQADGQLTLWRVNMRPGKPLAFGSYQHIPVIGLPGNPVSAFVTFQVFVVPVLHTLTGLPADSRAQVTVALAEPIESDGRETYARALVTWQNGAWTARLAEHQGSGNLLSLVRANALLIVPSGVKSLPVQSQAAAWWLNADLS